MWETVRELKERRGKIFGTWISRMRLWPLKAKAMIPSALRTSKTLAISVLALAGLYDTLGIRPSETEMAHIMVQ